MSNTIPETKAPQELEFPFRVPLSNQVYVLVNVIDGKSSMAMHAAKPLSRFELIYRTHSLVTGNRKECISGIISNPNLGKFMFPRDEMDVNAYEQEKELVNELKRKHLCSETDVARAIARFDYNKWSLTKAISGVYPISQLMNHSCLPNVALRNCPDGTNGFHSMAFALRDIAKDEPLVNSYLSVGLPLKVRKHELKHNFGFDCSCSYCSTCKPDDVPDLITPLHELFPHLDIACEDEVTAAWYKWCTSAEATALQSFLHKQRESRQQDLQVMKASFLKMLTQVKETISRNKTAAGAEHLSELQKSLESLATLSFDF